MTSLVTRQLAPVEICKWNENILILNGRLRLRRGRGMAGSPITESIDDSLAKAAHLHHYEQTKQKIIGSDNGINNDNDKSDDEAEDLEEHNFSIYECPGLAMSGDIEVKNPNFEQQHP